MSAFYSLQDDNKRLVNAIAGRLSLRTPQRDSLEILARIVEIAPPEKQAVVAQALRVIQSEFSQVEDFERDFPSLCFALATGVGKTRLMGAFIALLHLGLGIRHFFVLAPNLTIYNKLINDFTPGHGKYVLSGIAEFAQNPPEIITGDNYETGRGVRGGDLFSDASVHINIFNISKINSEVRGGKSPRIKRLSEYIGQSYFDYLSELDDLVLLMDESHRYRASAGIRAINELRPILGLELTATPQTETAGKPARFKNIVYDYPLANAIADGFVKEPAVATRENFNPTDYSDEGLEWLKLQDGVRVHENTKVELETFARNNDLPIVKPFMLVVARDTNHANTLVDVFKRPDFFNGAYKDKVITVHSNQRGEESDETIARLLAVEDPAEPTEIVIHVDKLKEGWDVRNLYTIVPLRAANSMTLVEQSIGRGLRLPYGKRMAKNADEAAVDRLTIIAHDKFQAIVDDANRLDSIIRAVVVIGRDVPEHGKKSVIVISQLETELLGESAAALPVAAHTSNRPVTPLPASKPQAPVFTHPEALVIAKLAMEVIKDFERKVSDAPAISYLTTPEVQAKLARQVEALYQATASPQPALAGLVDQDDSAEAPPDIEAVVAKVSKRFVERTIGIPRIIVEPKGEVTSGYRDFDLDVSGINLQPVDQHILIQHLRTQERERLSTNGGFVPEKRPEDYLVRGLIDFEDVSYDNHADTLYKLAGQVVAKLRSYLPDDESVENVLQYHQKKLVDLVHAQMQAHYWESSSEGYEAKVSRGFMTLRSTNFTADQDEDVRDVRTPIADGDKRDIASMLFGHFEKCLYPVQKFDSDAERRFAVLLEDDAAIEKWFKPARDQFQIHYRQSNGNTALYEPDFVIETKDVKYLCEPKRKDQISQDDVKAKAAAATEWCRHATEHELAHGGKPWRYLLIPHDAILGNMTLSGLAAVHSI